MKAAPVVARCADHRSWNSISANTRATGFFRSHWSIGRWVACNTDRNVFNTDLPLICSGTEMSKPRCTNRATIGLYQGLARLAPNLSSLNIRGPPTRLAARPCSSRSEQLSSRLGPALSWDCSLVLVPSWKSQTRHHLGIGIFGICIQAILGLVRCLAPRCGHQLRPLPDSVLFFYSILLVDKNLRSSIVARAQSAHGTSGDHTSWQRLSMSIIAL